MKNPGSFKWRHFHGEVILQCVRWYCKYGISYRDLEEMMAERGLFIDRTTLYRWVQHYAPELKKWLDWYKKRYTSRGHLDETYVRVKGEWKCLYRAITAYATIRGFEIVRMFNQKGTI